MTKKNELTEREIKIVKAYKELLDNPFADGYTWKAFESKYVKSETASKLYKRYLAQTRMNLTKEQAFDMIAEEVRKYNEAIRWGYCRSFPKEDIQEIIEGVRYE